MNDTKIDKLIAQRNKLLCRIDGLYDHKVVARIDDELSAIPAGVNNEVDKALGRPCATPTPRVDYGLSDKYAAIVDVLERGWIQPQSVTVEQAAPIAEAKRDEFLKWAADQTEDMLDFLGSRGDLAL